MALQIFGGGSAAAGGGGGGGLSLDSDGVPYFTVSGGDTTAPTVPGTPVATGGNTSASVAFTGSTDAVGVVGYRVYASTDSYAAVVASGASSPLSVIGLTNGTAVTFKVSAYDAAGNESAKSAASNSVTPAPSVTTLVSDNFNRVNDTSASAPGAPQIGPAPTRFGNVYIDNNQLWIAGTSGSIKWDLGGVNDYTFQFTYAANAGSPFWRYTDSNNAYRLDNNAAYKVVGGVATSMGALSPGMTPGAVVKVVASGSTHKVYINGALVLTFTDSTYLTGGPPIFIAASNAFRMDDILITTP